MELKKEKACGCIIIKDNMVLLVKGSGFWGVPKGHVEEDETEIQTALREVKEEVGLDVKIISDKRYVLNYIVNNEIDKTTVLYLAKPLNDNDIVKQESEIEDYRWCSFDEAINLLTFDNWKELFKNVIKDIS